MPAGRAFEVRIVGDVKDAKRALQGMEKRMGGFAKAMKGVAGAMAAAFAVQKVAEFVGSAINHAETMNSLYSETAQIIEATGEAAGISAGQIKDMNKEMAFRLGISKDKVTEVSNVLLTFKEITGDTFGRAQELTLDMAQAMKIDAKSAAVQMGKALNDPVKGVTALARAGVQFTDAQREQIDAMVESGDVAGAQNLILEEMANQFGGVAEATADSTAKIGLVKDEVMEAIGNVMLPLVDKLATWMVDVLLPAFKSFSKWIAENVPPWYKKYIKPTMDQIMKVAGKVIGWLSDFWEKNGDKIVANVKEVVGIVINYYMSIFNLYKRVLGPVIAWLADMWERYGDQIMDAMRAWWDVISTIISFIWDEIKNLVRLVTAIFNGDWAEAWEIAQEMAQRLGDFMREIPGKILGYLESLLRLIGPVLRDIGEAIGKKLVEKGQQFLDFMRDLPGKVLGYLSNLVRDIGPKAKEIGKKLVDNMVSGVGGMASAIRSSASSAARGMMNAFIGKWNQLDPRIKLPSMDLFGHHYGGQQSPDLLPDLPYLAKGGVVLGPTLAVLGEAGPEAVIPLSGTNTPGGNTYQITIQTLTGDPVAIGESLVELITEYERAAGSLWRSSTDYQVA